MDKSVSWRLNAERLVLLGWSRAILLQLAHPLVAAGVDEHSTFREGPLTAAIRLHHTVRAMLALAFGSEQQREAALDGIRAIHRRVHGTLRESVGRFPAGTAYSAEDPELLLWVHATLLESIPLVYDMLVAPLSMEERDTYCRESIPIVRALGVQDREPPQTWAEVGEYLHRMHESGAIVVSGTARELAHAVVRPPFSTLVAPAARINRLFAIGLLPPALRQQYGFSWRPEDERALRRWTAMLRRLRRLAPDVLALWPESRGRAGSTLAAGGRDDQAQSQRSSYAARGRGGR